MNNFDNNVNKSINQWFDATGKRLGFDVGYVATNSLWLYASTFVSALSAFVVAVVFARVLTPTNYGIYRFIHSVGGIISSFSLSGMNNAISQATARGDNIAMLVGVRYAFRWNVVVLVLGVSLSVYYYVQENSLLSVGIALLSFAYPFYLTYKLYAAYLVGLQNFKHLAFIHAVEAMLLTIVLVSAVFLINNPAVLIGIYYTTHLLFTYVLFRFFERTLLSDAALPENRPLFSYALHGSLMNVINPISYHIDKIVVFHYLGAAELAVYALAKAMPDQLKTLVNLSPLMIPRFAQRSASQISDSFWRKVGWLTAYSTLIVTAYYFVAPYLYTLFFPTYPESIFYSQLYAISLITVGASIPTAIYTAHKKIKLLYFQTNIQPLLRICLIVVLGYHFGILGIIAAITISRVLYMIASYVMFKIFY